MCQYYLVPVKKKNFFKTIIIRNRTCINKTKLFFFFLCRIARYSFFFRGSNARRNGYRNARCGRCASITADASSSATTRDAGTAWPWTRHHARHYWNAGSRNWRLSVWFLLPQESVWAKCNVAGRQQPAVKKKWERENRNNKKAIIKNQWEIKTKFKKTKSQTQIKSGGFIWPWRWDPWE